MEAIHVFDPPKRYNCLLCGENHLTEASLNMHISEVHRQNLVDTKRQPEPEADIADTCLPVCLDASKNPNNQHNCRKCGKALSQICPYNMEDTNSENPMRRVHRILFCLAPLVFTCTLCGKNTKSEMSLDCHTRSVHGPRPKPNLKQYVNDDGDFDGEDDSDNDEDWKASKEDERL